MIYIQHAQKKPNMTQRFLLNSFFFKCWGTEGRQTSIIVPEYENEEKEQGEEDGHVVHGAQHDDELTTQVGHETHKFQNAQETERTQNGESRTAPIVTFESIEALKDFHQTGNRERPQCHNSGCNFKTFFFEFET